MRLAALGAAVSAAAALACAAAATAAVPIAKTGSVLGEGRPLKAYASIAPTVHLFGDLVTAKLSIVADTKWVDPARIHVTAAFAPYRLTKQPQLLQIRIGRFEQLTWTWWLRCIESPCVPRVPPSDKYHVFHFPAARVDYMAPGGNHTYGLNVSWPAVEVLSQISPGVAAVLARTNELHWRYSLAPVAAPAYRFSPTLLFWLALALAGASLLVAGWWTRRWYATLHPPRPAAVVAAPGSTLDRAVALLRWAHEHGEETLQRKAFERVADELGVAAADELARTARELAWSPRTPQDDEVEEFAEQAQGRPHDAEGEDEPESPA